MTEPFVIQLQKPTNGGHSFIHPTYFLDPLNDNMKWAFAGCVECFSLPVLKAWLENKVNITVDEDAYTVAFEVVA